MICNADKSAHGRIRLLVIGASAGGFRALKQVTPHLGGAGFPPVIVVVHRVADADEFLETAFFDVTPLTVKQADEREAIRPGTLYFAPPNYHLLIEDDRTFALSLEAPVNHARPSIDVLFESAAEAYGGTTAGIILTGANNDGSAGLKAIKDAGGITVVQDPASAEFASMPLAAIRTHRPDAVLPVGDIGPFLKRLVRES